MQNLKSVCLNCNLDEEHSVVAEMIVYLHMKNYGGLELKLLPHNV